MTYLFLPIPFRSMCAVKAAVGVSEAGILGSSSGLLLLWSSFVFIFTPFSWSVFQMSKAICLAGLFSIFFVCPFSCGSSSLGFGGLFIRRVGFSSFSLLRVCSTWTLYLGVFPSILALLARGHPGASPTGLVWWQVFFYFPLNLWFRCLETPRCACLALHDGKDVLKGRLDPKQGQLPSSPDHSNADAILRHTLVSVNHEKSGVSRRHHVDPQRPAQRSSQLLPTSGAGGRGRISVLQSSIRWTSWLWTVQLFLDVQGQPSDTQGLQLSISHSCFPETQAGGQGYVFLTLGLCGPSWLVMFLGRSQATPYGGFSGASSYQAPHSDCYFAASWDWGSRWTYSENFKPIMQIHQKKYGSSFGAFLCHLTGPNNSMNVLNATTMPRFLTGLFSRRQELVSLSLFYLFKLFVI